MNWNVSSKVIFLSTLLFLCGFFFVDAANITDIRNQINDTNSQIRQIEQEIEEYEEELEEIGEEKRSLQGDIYTLDVNSKRLGADISLTQSKINNTNYTISEIRYKIGEKEEKIEDHKSALRESLKNINEQDQTSLIEAMFVYRKLTDFWVNVETLENFQAQIGVRLDELRALKSGLVKNKSDEEEKKDELSSLKSNLNSQRQVVEYNKSEKNKILAVTKNEEARYEEYLEEAEARREAFLQSLAQLESELRIAIDPSALPPVGSGVLAWPLKSIYITQKFGNTAFARSGAYNGSGHNGVDFRASIGTSVHSAGTGVVEAYGNTDAIPGCYSYGKWILVKHNTGLSTLYAHLSNINVSSGQSLSTGDVIGYSGNTGYSTGPHLHFGVYATQGVRVVRLGDIKSNTNCANATIPIAPFEAYLNPLDYL